MIITESDIKLMVRESVKKVLNEFNRLLYGSEPEYVPQSTRVKLDGFEIFVSFDKYCKKNGIKINDETLDAGANIFIGKEYVLWYDSSENGVRLSSDDGLFSAISTIQNPELKQYMSA
jgi:hypothetical protein